MQAQLTETVRGRAMSTTTTAQQEPVDATPSGQAAPDDQREQTIRQAAYALFEARGCVYGHELEDWLKAEEEVQQSLAGAAPAAASAPTRH